MRRYLHRKIDEYVGLYIRPADSALKIEPRATGDVFITLQTSEHQLRSGGKDHIAANTLSDVTERRRDPVDYVLLNGNIHYERDILSFFQSLESIVSNTTRLIIIFYSSVWKPLLRLATKLGIRIKMPEENWVAVEDLQNLLLLADYEIVRLESKLLIPVYIPLVSDFVNRFIAPLPVFRSFNLLNIAIARPVNEGNRFQPSPSVSVVIPARNEAGNIEAAVLRTPKMGPDDELIFIEGNSTDNTWETMVEVANKYKSIRNIRIERQTGKGKGDAVRKGFSLASKDVLMILDGDLTTPPEELPRFYNAIRSGKGEFINGSRLVYPMEKQAMRFFNMLGNKLFAIMFSFVLGQRFKDTLCGTKVLSRENYLRLEANRKFFGEFDPFGDFDLIFGAARMALRIVEVPVHYRERTYGDTNIQRWKHGLILLRMLMFAARKIKFT